MTVSVVVISPKRIDGDRKPPLTGLELNEAACFIVGDDEETAGSSLASFTGDRLMLEVKRQLLLMLLVSMGPEEEALERREAVMEQLEAVKEASPSKYPDSSELTEP